MYDLCNAKPVDFIDALHSALRDFFIEFCEIRCAVRGHTPCPGSHAPPDWDAACGGRWSQDIVEQDDLLTVYQTHWLKYDLGSSLIDIACHYLNARMEAKTKSDHRMAAFVLPPATVRQVRCARTRGPRRLGRDRNGDASTLLPLTPGPRARTSARLLHRSPLSLSLCAARAVGVAGQGGPGLPHALWEPTPSAGVCPDRAGPAGQHCQRRCCLRRHSIAGYGAVRPDRSVPKRTPHRRAHQRPAPLRFASTAELQTHGEGTVYRDSFEEPFLAQTKTFFARESAESIATLPMSDYLRLVRCDADVLAAALQFCR